MGVFLEDQQQKERNQIEKPKSSLNSFETGTYGWFTTLMGSIKHAGEYLKDKTPNEETLRTWGKLIEDNAREVIEGMEWLNQKK